MTTDHSSSSLNPSSFIKRPWFAFLSSMRFAVALLTVLAIASIIGTVLQQNLPMESYVVKFGVFWANIFAWLGLFDVYASWWFVLIMIFLVISTSLCLWRNVPIFWREMQSFRLKATAKSLTHMKHHAYLEAKLSPEIVAKYWQVNGFQTRLDKRNDAEILIAGKKGALNKWGYICAHTAIIVICLGGLIDSNLFLKLGMLTGKIRPDSTTQFAKDFPPESILTVNNPSFRSNVEISEGQTVESSFVNADKGLLLQQLPFTVQLKKFHIDFYETGMPKDFASDVVITDKATGQKVEKTIRVNHPHTQDGITIYQANYGDGGSKISFKTWDLRTVGSATELKVQSRNQYPLNLGQQKFQLEFDDLKPFNVENVDINDARAVKQGKKFQNIGASIVYRIRDEAGQAYEYMNYMLPLARDGAYFFATGERSSPSEPYRWLMIPADPSGKMDSFLALREILQTPSLREKVVEQATQSVNEQTRQPFKLAVENLLRQFSEGGYRTIDAHIKKTVPPEQQQKTGETMYQILIGAMNVALAQGLQAHHLPDVPDEVRLAFLMNSLDAYTGLMQFHAPVLMQLDAYQEVKMSGLQLTKSPGAGLVYLGSLLLVLGTVFMFYVREKRVWVLLNEQGMHVAMSSSRHERDLNREFPEHQEKLGILMRDLNAKADDSAS